jgi:signal transduction histidine kinase/CheY-like chemotaxis protein
MRFSELVNIQELRELCENFTTATGAVTAILDLEGNILIATGWQDICTRFHRLHETTAKRCLESDTSLAGSLQQGQNYAFYKCQNCLHDVAVPIKIRGEHVANFFTGQFFTTPPDREFFVRQAETFGFDKKAYLDALDKVPIFSETKIKAMAEFFIGLAQLIGEIGWAKKELTEANQTLRKHQEHLEDLVSERTAQLKAAKDEAESANRAKSAFLASMSHELRTPLNAVIGFSRLMNHNPAATAEQKECLGIINQSGEHLLNLINNVLDLSKIEAGRGELEEREFDLHHLLHEIQSLMHVRAVEKGLDFSVRLPPDLPRYLNCDQGKLRQILINLAGNAIKYTRHGQILVRATAMPGESPTRTRVKFEVSDTGPGIGPADYERIFQPFVQLSDRAANEPGSGLGLAICKQHVELMGGQLALESTLGKGSVFYFEIPAGVPTGTPPPTTLAHAQVVGLAAGQPRHRILIAEDQRENRMLLRRILQPLDFDLREATQGQEAVAISAQWHPHLIWMDIRMPVMDGLEATRRIKAAATGANTKIIALTAHALEEERRHILAAGCDEVIRKPYREAELFEAMARHLHLKYTYASPPAATGRPAGEWSPARLVALPPILARRLRQAVIELDTTETHKLISQIAALDEGSGATLETLANRLEYDRLLTILESTQEGLFTEK